jgi:hypothetical protein
MASAPPVDQHDPAMTTRLPAHRRARMIALCALLAVIAVMTGLILGSGHHGPSHAAADALAASTDSAVVATAPPGAPTPTPLANKPTPTAAPIPTPTTAPPTAIPPTDPPPVVAPAFQSASAPVAPNAPHDNGNGKGKGKAKGKD